METLVLVLTDVQGSTRLWQDEPGAMDAAMRRHHEIVHTAVKAYGGFRPVDQGEGDAVFAAFRSATAALEAVVSVQQELAAEPWATSIPLKVRVGVHVGEVTERDGNLYGDPVNRCARLRGLGAGGQTLLSAPVYELVRDKLPTGVAFRDLGEHRMKDLVRPEHVWQLDVDGLAAEFPPLASLDRVLHNLPVQPSPLIGRETELAAALAALESHRLVTLTGFGGMGKTRLALQAAAELAEGDGDGVWFVDLAAATDPAQVPGLIGRATGLGGSTADEVVAALSGQQLLLVLDNLEQVLGCAPFVAELLARVPGVKVLATSREPLRVRGEQEIPIAPLALPPTDSAQDAETLSTYAAVQLFVQRAVAVRPDFAVTNDNAPAVAAICQRLDGHPLAIELAAARVKMMSPQALLPRLDSALTVLTGGSRDLPDRHQTLRATIAWSYDLLEPDEQLLLDRISVFAGSTTFEHVEGVCGHDLNVFTALSSLVDKSLVRTSIGPDGEDRYGLLVSIRAYSAERHAAAGLAETVREQHCAWFQQTVAWPPPRSRAEVAERERRALPDLDDLQLAWELVDASGDRARVAAFPIALAHLWDRLGDRDRAAQLYGALADAAPLSLKAAEALATLCYLKWELGVEVDAGRPEQLMAVAADLDRPDVTLRTAMYAAYRHAMSAEERLAHVDRLHALAAEPPLPDSPWPPDEALFLADNWEYSLLMYVDPVRARNAARRCWQQDPDSALYAANYARSLHEAGEHEQALAVVAPQLAVGLVRDDPVGVQYAVQVAALAMLALGRPGDAVAAMDVWQADVERRGYPGEKRRQLGVRAWALLQQGRLDDAHALVISALTLAFRPLPQVQVLHERTERLTGRLDNSDRLPALIEALRPTRYTGLNLWLCLLVEQALRAEGDDRRRLLQEVDTEQRGLYLPFGYEADLDQLRTEL